jgi:hypothetical protein
MTPMAPAAGAADFNRFGNSSGRLVAASTAGASVM